MFLAVDIGNTNTEFGLFQKNRLLASRKIPTDTLDDLTTTWRTFRWGTRAREIRTVLVASVKPPATAPVLEWAARDLRRPAVTLGIDCPVPIPVRVRNPWTVGIDRLVNALAAHKRFGGPAVIVDVGTAITVDAVSATGEFLGGAIAPGIALCARALHRDCAQLPLLDVQTSLTAPLTRTIGQTQARRLCYPPPTPHARTTRQTQTRRPSTPVVPAIGKCTEEAIMAGLYWGLIGTVSQLVREIESEFGEPMRLVATGGGVDLVVNHLRADAVIARDLTLSGIVLAYMEVSKQ